LILDFEFWIARTLSSPRGKGKGEGVTLNFELLNLELRSRAAL